MNLKYIVASTIVFGGAYVTLPAASQEKDVIGAVLMMATNFCPAGTFEAKGQTLAISGQEDLFHVIGTTFGGDGQTTFKLPDMTERGPIGQGTGVGLTERKIGDVVGAPTATIPVANMPAHSHAVNASTSASQETAVGGIFGQAKDNTVNRYLSNGEVNAALAGLSVSTEGTDTPLVINTRSPYVGITYCIVYEGTLPKLVRNGG